jgi:hypothetical protein
MSLPGFQIRHYQVELLSEHYVLSGELEPFGPLMIYLNDPERSALRLKNLQGCALDPGLTIDNLRSEDMMVRKDEVILIRPLDAVSQSTVPLLARRQVLQVFINRFVLQAAFPCGQETQVSEIFDLSPGHWVACVDAQVYPLQRAQQSIFHEAKLVLLNKHHVRFYQAVKPKS